ncbi:MAG: hypothetical protein ACI9FJ_000192 [Alteromonadaceae bacterium]|jgi:hypothetical protein
MTQIQDRPLCIPQSETHQLSSQLLQLLEPYMDLSAHKKPRRRLNAMLLVASSAWNYAATGRDIFRDSVYTVLVNPSIPCRLTRLFDKLVERKNQLFADQPWVILDFTVLSFDSDAINIKVAGVTKAQYEHRVSQLISQYH